MRHKNTSTPRNASKKKRGVRSKEGNLGIGKAVKDKEWR
jgi:hypothetical protein